MGLMDKFKNLFTDEEFDEEEDIEEPVKIKEVKKEEHKKSKDKLPTFMREKLEKEEKEDEIADFKLNNTFENDFSKDFSNDFSKEFSEKPIKEEKKEENIEITETKETFKFPIDLDDSDFNDVSEISRVSRQARTNKTKPNPEEQHVFINKKENKQVEHKKDIKVAELYKDKREKEEETTKKFKATPIISPIYGVLDKNYRKEEIETRGDNYEINRPSKSIDFDSVRKKAYGNKKKNNLEEDIKNNLICEDCDYFKNAKTCKKDSQENNLMYEALCETKEKETKDITLDEAAENYFDYGVEYEKAQDIDSYIEKEEEEVKIVNHEEETIEEPVKKKKNDVPPVKSSINLLSTLKKSMDGEDEVNSQEESSKNLELTDDLFNLIDSMYDEGNE